MADGPETARVDEVADLVCQPLLASLLAVPLALIAAVGTAGWWRLAGYRGTHDWWALAVPVGVAIGGTLGGRLGKLRANAATACQIVAVWLAGVVLPTWAAGQPVGHSAYVWATLLVAGVSVATISLTASFVRWHLSQALARTGDAS